MIARIYDRLIAAAAALLLVSLLGWYVVQRGTVAEITSRPVTVALASDSYEAQPITLPTSSVRVWSDPANAAAEPEWVFDVFTPPVIYYNRLTKAFTVTPPDYSTPDEPEVVVEAPPPFGVELVEVALDPFRLQLVGYAGSEGNYLGMFENALTGDTVLGRAGKTIPDLGLTIVALDVKKERIELPDSMPIVQTVAKAIVRDDSTMEEFDLTSLKRRATGSPSAVLRVTASNDQRTEKVGAEFTAGGVTYRIDDMDVDANTVTVSRLDPADPEEITTVVLEPTIAAAPATDADPDESDGAAMDDASAETPDASGPDPFFPGF